MSGDFVSVETQLSELVEDVLVEQIPDISVREAIRIVCESRLTDSQREYLLSSRQHINQTWVMADLRKMLLDIEAERILLE